MSFSLSAEQAQVWREFRRWRDELYSDLCIGSRSGWLEWEARDRRMRDLYEKACIVSRAFFFSADMEPENWEQVQAEALALMQERY